ncbi:MAG: hypothetical protein RIC55_17700 [Pirellulaceae bacterium]
MSAAGLLRFAYYAYLSRPAGERVLYRAMRRLRPRRIVELGLGDARRAQRLIRTAQRYAAGESVRYTGVDLFEMRPAEQARIGIKQAYHDLRAMGATVQLAPGDPFSALARIANALTGTDLLVIAADNDAPSLARAWFYIPRMLHERTRVYLEHRDGDASTFRLLKRSEIEALAATHERRPRRAA